MQENNGIVSQPKIDPNNVCDTGGPPTPTHSETQDELEQKCTFFFLAKFARFLSLYYDAGSLFKFFFVLYLWPAGSSPDTATPGVSALQGIQLQGFYPTQLPQLTPGLSQFVNDDLTEHIRGWPAETCEKQVISFS